MATGGAGPVKKCLKNGTLDESARSAVHSGVGCAAPNHRHPSGRDVKMKNMLRLLVIASPALLAASCNKTQYTAYALTANGTQIIEFDTKKPDKITNTLNLTGLTDDQVSTIF